MPKLAALASAADNICFASSSVRLAYVRGISPHLNTDRFIETTLSFFFSLLHLTRIHFCVFLSPVSFTRTASSAKFAPRQRHRCCGMLRQTSYSSRKTVDVVLDQAFSLSRFLGGTLLV